MNFTIDPVALHNAAGKFTQYAEDYSAICSRLLNAAQTMGDAWNSEDNLAFVDQINGLCSSLKAMADRLEQSARIMNQQATNYETVRDSNIASVKKLAN